MTGLAGRGRAGSVAVRREEGQGDKGTKIPSLFDLVTLSPCQLVSFFALTFSTAPGTSGALPSPLSPRGGAASRNGRTARQGVGRVKKPFASLAGLTVLGGFVVWAGWAAAQQPQPPIRQPPGTSTTNTAAPASAQR